MPPATHGPSAGGGRRAVGARSRTAAAALRLDLLHGPALDRPAVDEAGREALRGSMAKVGGTQGRGACVRLCGVWYVVCVWCVAAAAEKARAHQRDHAGHRCEGAVHPDHSAVLRHPTPPVSGLTRVASPLHPSPLIAPVCATAAAATNARPDGGGRGPRPSASVTRRAAGRRTGPLPAARPPPLAPSRVSRMPCPAVRTRCVVDVLSLTALSTIVTVRAGHSPSLELCCTATSHLRVGARAFVAESEVLSEYCRRGLGTVRRIRHQSRKSHDDHPFRDGALSESVKKKPAANGLLRSRFKARRYGLVCRCRLR